MNELLAWLRENNIPIDNPILDGEVHRFSPDGTKDEDGYYVGSRNTLNGIDYPTITVKDFRYDNRLYYDGRRKAGRSFSVEENIVFERQRQLEADRVREHREQRAKECKSVTAQRLKDSKLVTDHPYLISKGLNGYATVPCHNKELLIPVTTFENEIVGAQRIFPDGMKRFVTGTRKQGCFHLIAPSNDTCWEFIGVTEGYATGLTIHMALGIPVYVAFDAGNLKPVAENIRHIYPDRKIVIFADDDRYKKNGNLNDDNKGRKCGIDAAKSIQGLLIFPSFGDEDKTSSDWNDLYLKEGIDEVKRQLNRLKTNNNPIYPQNESKANEALVTQNGKGDGSEVGDEDVNPYLAFEFESKEEKDDVEKKKPARKKFDQEKINKLGCDILDCRFMMHITPEKTTLYNITNIKNKEVELCHNEEFLTKRLRQNIEELFGKPPDVSFVNKVYTSWRACAKPMPYEPRTFTWKNQDEWSFKKLDFDPCPGDYPAWEEFLARLSSREDFMAFIWSIFEMKNRSRQYLYLYDPAGEGGKTTVINVLADVFGKSFGALNNANTNGSAQRWLLGKLYGKRLAAWGDCKNPKFCMSEIIRNVTSGDQVDVEFKGANPFSTRMYLKLIIGSNHEPTITSGGADLSRLINIYVTENKDNKDDTTWAERLKTQLPHFLWACKSVYDAKCPNHGKILLSEATKSRVDAATEELESRFEDILHRRIVFDKAFETPSGDWLKMCNEEKLSSFDIGNLKDYLKRHHAITVGRKQRDNKKTTVYFGMRVKPLSVFY